MKRALVIIDLQMTMQDRIDSARDHVNPDAPDNVAALVAAFRENGHPVIHVRHRDEDRASPLHPDAPGHQPMPCAREVDGEPVFFKTTSSAFASTDLEDFLRKEGITDLVTTGAVAGFCVNSTVRAGADLGFKMSVVRDAVIGFDLPEANLSARVIFDVTMAHLEADFADVVEASSVLASQSDGGS